MKQVKKCTAAVLLLTLMAGLCGCATTVEEMYRLPRRSEGYENLQVVIGQTMGQLEYSAPGSGENQQTVQVADLDGDGNSEVILFAKGGEENPLKILLFTPSEEGYDHLATLESPGTGFDQVEYVQMDGKPGMELVVGRKVSDQVLRNVSVYSFADGQPNKLMDANYVKFITCDLNQDQLSDLFVIHPGMEKEDRALAELYSMENGMLERSAEAELSGPADRLKRIVTGCLQSGEAAVYVASTAGEQAIITDVFAMTRDRFTNVSFSNESGTSVKTLRNYFVYADDIDGDGVVEIPNLITMEPTEQTQESAKQHLIRWYAMGADGSETDKMFTYHNFVQGWYVEIEEELAYRTLVEQNTDGGYQFYFWDESKTQSTLVYTIYVLTGEDRLSAAQKDLTQLLKTDNAVYASKLEPTAAHWGITADYLSSCFHLIQVDWKTGEM